MNRSQQSDGARIQTFTMFNGICCYWLQIAVAPIVAGFDTIPRVRNCAAEKIVAAKADQTIYRHQHPKGIPQPIEPTWTASLALSPTMMYGVAHPRNATDSSRALHVLLADRHQGMRSPSPTTVAELQELRRHDCIALQRRWHDGCRISKHMLSFTVGICDAKHKDESTALARTFR
jgi:hypothetical protein